ncbi:hypothetical protein LT330_002258 [Penicillium expansum]|nr:hypothetical protein LT330_002258 [Penicillium expansum]
MYSTTMSAGSEPPIDELTSHGLLTDPPAPLSTAHDVPKVQNISAPDSKAVHANSVDTEPPKENREEGPGAKDDLDAVTPKIEQNEDIDWADGADDEFLRLRAKVQEIRQKARDIAQTQAMKAELMELQEILGNQIDSNHPDHPKQTLRERSDVLFSMEAVDQYREQGLDRLYAYMPDEYRREKNLRPYDAMRHTAGRAARKARPSPFLDGYIQPQADDLAFEFTRRRLKARYSYEREMEYLYAVQERYDGMRAQTLEREMQKKEAQRRAKEEEEEGARSHAAHTESVLQADADQDNPEKNSSQPGSKSKSSEAEVHAEATMNRIEWLRFRTHPRQIIDLGSRSVLEILIGEPETSTSYDILDIPIHHIATDKSDDILKDRKTATKSLLPGQAPLPERIRIKCVPLLHLLSRIQYKEVSYDSGSLIMTRPFKALSYYEKDFRLWHDALATKQEDRTKDTEDTESIPENTLLDQITGQEWFKTPSIVLQHLTCLLDFIDDEITAKKEYLTSENHQMVTFADLWYLFKPGDEVIGHKGLQAYRILSVTSPKHQGVLPRDNFYNRFVNSESEEKPMRIHCVYVDFDGKELGPISEEFEIEAFDGEKSITLLPVQPLRFSKTPGLREKLIQRGREYITMTAVKHMHCSGLTLDTRDEVDGQVVIDFSEALSVPANKHWKPEIEELLGNIPDAEAGKDCSAQCCKHEVVYDDSHVDTKRNEDFMGSLNPQDRSRLPSVAVYPRTLAELDRGKLTDDELLIMSYRVFGFVLRTRKWAPLDIADLVGVRSEEDGAGHKRETPFDKLVLPPGHKQMVQSLIAQHFRDKESGGSRNEQVDFVRGKGKGLIMLLHGAPGVGKTSTAECIADLFQKPLFQITCGDLGSTAKEVEEALETNFSLANRWGCILLLDEADVFLAARTPTDFTRNGLVAVFLRVLEYYAGILFLTTNRVGDFDEAFASRIHISLYYPPLTLISTIQVFQLNLAMIIERFQTKGRKIHIDKQILEFVSQYFLANEKARLNGRQIRNACQTALALAEFEAQGGKHDAVVDAGAEVRLQEKHLKTVTDAYLEFAQHLKDIFGAFADERAQDQNLRAQSKMSETVNPLLSYNSHASQPSPPTLNVPAAQQGYPSGPMQQPAGPFFQAPYPQQFPSGFAYGSPGNFQNMPQQVPQNWPGMMNIPIGATGPSQHSGLPAGTTAFPHGQTNPYSPENQEAPH